jgi:hypothetical protein
MVLVSRVQRENSLTLELVPVQIRALVVVLFTQTAYLQAVEAVDITTEV